MTQENAKIAYYTESCAAKNNVNIFNLVRAIALNGKEIVSVSRDGEPHTFIQEIGEIGRLTNKAYARESVNYYRRYVAMDSVEAVNTAKTAYIRAAKKIIFLNTVCKKQFGLEGFISRKIDLTNMDEVKALVDAFDFSLRTRG